MDRYAQTEDNMIAFPSQTNVTCMHWSKKQTNNQTKPYEVRTKKRNYHGCKRNNFH